MAILLTRIRRSKEMVPDIRIPSFKDLDKILHDKLVEKVIDELAHRHDDEDVEDAIINGLDED
jgi:hypothetical protein